VRLGASSTRTVAELGSDGFAARLRGEGLGVRLGPFDVKIGTTVQTIEEPLFRLYRDYPLLDDERVFNIHVRLEPSRNWPRIHKKTVRLLVDGRVPHEDLPFAHALPAVEWGLNLVIALRSHSWLMLHSAAVERDGGVMLFPAWPGSGKTTLCAALVHRGWRLFSDEFGLVAPSTCEVAPIPRPMPLKNESIEVIRAFAPDAELGPTIPNTRKGTIVHVKAPLASVRAAHVGAPVRWIVFPQWSAGAGLAFEEVAKADAFMMLATNAFNYEMLGELAFSAVRRLVVGAQCFRLLYSDLDRAIELLDRVAGADGVAAIEGVAGADGAAGVDGVAGAGFNGVNGVDGVDGAAS
jgi:HprK-related kinase A